MSARLNFLCVNTDSLSLARCQELATEFHYSMASVTGAAEIQELHKKYDQVQFTLVRAGSLDLSAVSELVKAARQAFKDSFICVVVSSIDPAMTDAIRKASGSLVLFEREFFETSRLEFTASQIIRASFVPVKLSEFPKDCVLDFSLYHLMPLNQKILPILPKGSPLNDSRLKKLEGISEVFVRRDEVDRYRRYVESHPDVSNQGLRSRCRAQYLSFSNSHTQLVFLLMDQNQNISAKESKWLFDRCEIQSRELIKVLSTVNEVWDVVNSSSLGEFGSVERAPTIAAYAGILSLTATIGEPIEVMIAGLLSDVGMLDLSPSITRKIRQSHGIETLTAEELRAYQKHPELSLNLCLSKKLQLQESTKDIILSTHERADGKGFPDGRIGMKIPQEAMLIQFSEQIDRGAQVVPGKDRMPVDQVRQEVLNSSMKEGKVFSLPFLDKIKPVI